MATNSPDLNVQRVVEIVNKDLIRHVTRWRDLANFAAASPELQDLVRNKCGPFQGKFLVDLTARYECCHKMDDYLEYLPPARKLIVKLEDMACPASTAGLFKLIRSWDRLALPAEKGGKVCLSVDANRDILNCDDDEENHYALLAMYNRDASIMGPFITHLRITEEDGDDMYDIDKYTRMNHYSLPIRKFDSLISFKSGRKITLAHVMDILNRIPKPDKLKVLKVHADSDGPTVKIEKQVETFGKLVNLTKLELTIYASKQLADLKKVLKSVPPGSFGKLKIVKIESSNSFELNDRDLVPFVTTVSDACPALRKMILFGTVF